jgi:hypothetical protein
VRSCAGAPRICCGGPSLRTFPPFQKEHAVRDLARKLHLVRHDDHGHAVPGQHAHGVQNLADELGVEGRGRLIEQDELRLHGQRAGDGHALLLSAGQPGRVGLQLVRETHLAQEVGPDRLGLLGGQFAHHERPERDVLQCGHMWEKVEALKHHADVGALAVEHAVGKWSEGAVGLVQAHGLAVDEDAPALGHLEDVDATQERGLAGAAGADHDDHFAGAHGEIDAIDHHRVAEALHEPIDAHHRLD